MTINTINSPDSETTTHYHYFEKEHSPLEDFASNIHLHSSPTQVVITNPIFLKRGDRRHQRLGAGEEQGAPSR